MGQQSPPTFDEYVTALRDSAVKLGVEVLKRELVKRLPFLFYPVLSPITNLLINKLVTLLIQETEFAAFFAYIDLRTSAQGRTFRRAAMRNRLAQQSSDPKEKEDAEQELIRSFRRLVVLSS